jgi:hypothetical protein
LSVGEKSPFHSLTTGPHFLMSVNRQNFAPCVKVTFDKPAKIEA